MKKNQSVAYHDTTRQPKRTLGQSTLGGLLGQLPATIKNASTIQKLVGGTLLALGVAYVARGKKKRRPATRLPRSTSCFISSTTALRATSAQWRKARTPSCAATTSSS